MRFEAVELMVQVHAATKSTKGKCKQCNTVKTKKTKPPATECTAKASEDCCSKSRKATALDELLDQLSVDLAAEASV